MPTRTTSNRRPPVRLNRLAVATTTGLGLLAGRQAGADTYAWATPADGFWSTGFTPATPPSSSNTQLVFIAGSYNAYDDLGPGPDGMFDLNTITVNNSDANSITLGVNSAGGGTGPAPLQFGGAGSGLVINGGSVTLGLTFNTADGTRVVNGGGGDARRRVLDQLRQQRHDRHHQRHGRDGRHRQHRHQ